MIFTFMDKEKEILKYSNPMIVFKKFNKNYKDGIIKISNRKDKKYMILHNNKWIHFGQFGYEDFTKHNDENRRQLFLKRNNKWKLKDKYSPAYLSYFLLW